MVEERLSAGRTLFARALAIFDAVAGANARAQAWSVGGGTPLMLRLRHRVSTDIGICVADPQMIKDFSPRLNPAAADLAWGYAEHPNFIRLYLPEGEIEVTATASLTRDPVTDTRMLGREVRLETPAEYIARRIWYRAATFTAQDVFDFACVAEREPAALMKIREILAARRAVLLQRLEERGDALREDFDALDVLDYRPEFEDCLDAIAVALAQIAPRLPHRAEQTLGRYELPHRPIHASAAAANRLSGSLVANGRPPRSPTMPLSHRERVLHAPHHHPQRPDHR